MPIGTVLTTVAAYVAIAILLLSLNLTSRWRWWIKGAAIAITGVFFVVSYLSIVNMFGWPTGKRLPARFSLISTHVQEPDRFRNTEGAIYLWVREIDENNVPIGPPRNFEIVYTEPLAEAADEAQERLDAGETVEGRLEELSEEEPGQTGEGTPTDGAGNTGYELDFTLQFNDMPIVNLPEKGVL